MRCAGDAGEVCPSAPGDWNSERLKRARDQTQSDGFLSPLHVRPDGFLRRSGTSEFRPQLGQKHLPQCMCSLPRTWHLFHLFDQGLRTGWGRTLLRYAACRVFRPNNPSCHLQYLNILIVCSTSIKLLSVPPTQSWIGRSQYLKVSHLIQKTPCKIEVRSRYSLFRPRTRHRRTETEMLLLPRGPFNSNLPTSNHAERKRGSSRENKTERGSRVSCIFFETEYLGWDQGILILGHIIRVNIS